MRPSADAQDRLQDEFGRLCALTRYGLLDSAPDRRFDEITALVRRLFDVPVALVSLVDENRQWFLARDGLDLAETPRSFAFCGQTIRTRETLSVPDAATDARFCDNPLVLGPPHVRSYHGAPLETPAGYNIGALCILDTRPRSFDAERLALLRDLAGVVVRLVEGRQTSRLDRLTGTLGQSALMEVLNVEMARCHRTFTRSALCLLDVDDLGAINAACGTAAGDAVIRSVAGVCTSAQRVYDTLGRIGDNRFALILPAAAAEGANAAMDRIRRKIAALRIPEAPDLAFTVSTGTSEVESDFMAPGDWLETSAAVLARAKALGKNRCEI